MMVLRPPFDEHVGFDHAGERDDFSAKLHGIAHRERVWMTRHGDEVFGLENIRLFKDAAADFAQGKAMDSGIVALQPAGLLHRLKCDPADTRLL